MADTDTDTTAAPLPGSYFDVPGIPGGSTQWVEQDETTTNQLTVHAQANGVPISGILPYRQTDVVTDWFLYLSIAQTYTTGTSTLTASAYAPFNVIGSVQQLIQNQYGSVQVESGIDLYIFNMARPHAAGELLGGVNNGDNPAGAPASTSGTSSPGYRTTALAQVNAISAAQWSPASTAYNIIMRLPAAQWFDRYYDLAVTGEPVTQPHPALVSPQFMAGTTRNIIPVVNINQGSGNLDVSPVNISAGSGTYVGSSTARFRRKAIYAGNPAVQPPVYAWQYRWKTSRFSLAGVQSVDIIVPNDTGQLLMGYVRMFDPAAAAGLGAPININAVTRFNLQYGSGLFWHDATTRGGTTAAELVQRRWLETHSNLLPAGVLGYDLAIDDRQQMTNARALNTLTTGGILFHIDFTAAQSASAYAVLGTESLVYVT